MRAARLLTTVRNDVRLQWRHGFYAAYLLLTLLYILVLRLLPEEGRRILAPLIVFSDPAVIGFFFVGGIVLLERGDRTLEALFVTPLRVAEYLLSKTISLGLLATVTAIAIATGVEGTGVYLPALVPGTLLTAALAVLAGIALVSRFETLNRFAFGGGLSLAVFSLPLLHWLGWVDWPLLAVLPTYASIVLIGGAFAADPPSAALLAASSLWLLLWNVAAWMWARRWFELHVVGGASGKGD